MAKDPRIGITGGGSGKSGSVKVVKFGPGNAAKFNQGSMMKTTDAATGAAARKGAASLGVTGKKGVQPPIKINTAVKSAPKDKATTRGLKAANSVKTPKLSKADTKKFNSQIDKNAAKYKADKKKSK